MKKRNIEKQIIKVIYALRVLGGIGSTIDIRKKCNELDYTEINLRACLRMMERYGIVKKTRMSEESIELRWEFTDIEAVDNFLKESLANN